MDLEDECIDRISELQDEILGKILSYLPVKDVVASSVLSTRWKPLFPSSVVLTKLDLDDKYTLRRNKYSRLSSTHHFISFVDKLLNVTLRDAPYVETVVFNIDKSYGQDVIASWVSASLRLKVQHLQLMIQRCYTMKLIESLHGCSTLVELELGNFADLFIPEGFILPNLKKMSLFQLKLVTDEHFDNLLDGCPVLNDLRITKCCFRTPYTYHIQHPNIKKLFVDGFISWTVVTHCPNLEAIVLKGRVFVEFDLMGSRSLHSVCIDFYCRDAGEKGDIQLARLVRACSSTTRLCLTGNVMMYLDMLLVPLPTFRNLTCLALGRMGCYEWTEYNGWTMFVRLLESAPNLTVLTFEEELDFTLPYTDSKSLPPLSTGANTDIDSLLPVNLLLNIKKIEIWKFKWIPDEIRLIEYFLKEGKVLQELIVHCLPCDDKSGLEKLLMLPRYSKACQVVFKDKNNLGKSRYSRENWF